MSKLDVIIKEINSQFKENIAARGIARIDAERIPFSSPRANYMLYGGIPRGRLVEFYGDEGSGKTTSALDVAANAQLLFEQEWQDEIDAFSYVEKLTKTQQQRLEYLKQRGVKQVVYADCENTLDEDWAMLLGVDVDSLVVLKPLSQSAEQIFQILLDMIETDEVGLAIIDSLGVMLSAQAYDKTMEEKTYGGIAMALTLFSKKAENACAKYNCTLIGINQMRADMNSTYGGMTTTGGKAWRHNCSVRLAFQKGNPIDAQGNELKKSAETPAGNMVMMSVAKTKICKPDRKTGFYTLNYYTGINVVADTVDTCLKFGYIVRAGAWFTFADPETGEVLVDETGKTIQIQGAVNVVGYLEENEELFNQYYAAVSNKLEE